MKKLKKQLTHNSTLHNANFSIGDKVIYINHNGELEKGKVLETAFKIRPAVRVKSKCLDGSIWLLESSCLKCEKSTMLKNTRKPRGKTNEQENRILNET